MKKEVERIYCRENGHDWIIHDCWFWDTAECSTCGIKKRDVIIIDPYV